MIAWLVVTFFAVVATGPDGTAWFARRRAELQARKDFPVVKQLQAGACQVCRRRTCPYR